MATWKVAAACLVTLVAACTSRPSTEEVAVVLQQNLPETIREAARIETSKTEMATTGQSDSMVVKFKAQVRISEPLYAAVDLSRAAEKAGVDLAKFSTSDRMLQSIPDNLRTEFEGEIRRLSIKPTFVEERVQAGAMSEWYGSYRATKVVDRWVVSDFHTDVPPAFVGVKRAALPPDSVPLQTAPVWFTETQRDYDNLLRRISDAQRVHQAEARATEAQAAAQHERDAREQVVAAATQQALKMPISYRFRSAALSGSMVLQMQVITPMTVTLNVTRGHQHFSRDLQLLPGRTVEFGHIEGWGFRGGDEVTLTNSRFSPVVFSAP